MADTVKKIKLYQGNEATAYELEATVVDAANVTVSNQSGTQSKNLNSLLLDDDGEILELGKLNLDETYPITVQDANNDDVATLNLRQNGIGVKTGNIDADTAVVTPLKDILGVIGNEGDTNFNTQKGLALQVHTASDPAFIGGASNTAYGHVKLVETQEQANIAKANNHSSVAIGLGLLDTVSSGTLMKESDYVSQVNYKPNSGTYYVYNPDEDFILSLKALLKSYNKTAKDLTVWSEYYANTDSIAYNLFVSLGFDGANYSTYVLNSTGKFSYYCPNKPLS